MGTFLINDGHLLYYGWGHPQVQTGKCPFTAGCLLNYGRKNAAFQTSTLPNTEKYIPHYGQVSHTKDGYLPHYGRLHILLRTSTY